VQEAFATGELSLEGDKESAKAFFSYFDPPSSEPVKLIVL